MTEQKRVGADFFKNRLQGPTTDGQPTGTTIPSQAPIQVTTDSKGFNLGEQLAAADVTKTPVDISVEEFLLLVLLQHVRSSSVLNYHSPALLSTEEQTFIEELRTTDGAARTVLLKEVFIKRV